MRAISKRQAILAQAKRHAEALIEIGCRFNPADYVEGDPPSCPHCHFFVTHGCHAAPHDPCVALIARRALGVA